MKYVTAAILGLLFVFLVAITLGMLKATVETGNPLTLLVGLLGTASMYWIVFKQYPKLQKYWDKDTF